MPTFRGHNFATDVSTTSDDWELLAEWELPDDVVPGQRAVGVGKADPGLRFDLGASVSVDGETWSPPESLQADITDLGTAFDVESIWPYLRFHAKRTPDEPGEAAQANVNLSMEPTMGDYAFSFEGDTTDPIPFDASVPDVIAALNALPSITAAGGVQDGGSVPGSQLLIDFVEPGVRSAVTLASNSTDADLTATMNNSGVDSVPQVDGAGVVKLRLF